MMNSVARKRVDDIFQIPVTIDNDHGRYVVGGEPHVFHCHHYNLFLQQSIRDAESYADLRPALVEGGARVAYAQLRKIFAECDLTTISERFNAAQEIYRWAGFGTFKLDVLSREGGTIETAHSHYAMAWKAKFGFSKDENVCFFDRGWLSGCLSAVFDEPLGAFDVVQKNSLSQANQNKNTFVIKRSSNNYVEQNANSGVGKLTSYQPIDSSPPPGIDQATIVSAVQSLPLVGDDQGEIEVFGVYLTRHYANYYNHISTEFLKVLAYKFGSQGVDIAEPLLIESGHVCAFNTFGGIMESSEWEALIQPNLSSKEDWVYGIVAVVNALGWGRWQVQNVSAESATFVIQDDYEEVGYLSKFGKSGRPINYLAQGATIGIMNLIYYGGIDLCPELTPVFYDSLFKIDCGYQAEVLQAQCMGAPQTVIRVFQKESS